MQMNRFYIFLLLFLAGSFVNAQQESSIAKSFGQNRFTNKAPFEVKDSVVCFFLRGNTTAKRVILSGNFINWSPDALSMNKTDSGWITNVKLGPGKYLYKFIIDGNWITDRDNNITETDDQGNVNSIFFIPNTVFTFNGFLNTKKVYLVASSLNWGLIELQMYKAHSGWKLPLYLAKGVYNYYFLADGKKIIDRKNLDQLPDEKNNPGSVLYINLPDNVKQTFRSYQKAITSHNKKAIAANLSKIGDFYLSQSDYPNAQRSYERSLTIYQQLRNYDSIGSMYLKIEVPSRYEANFTKQLSSIQNAIKAFEQSKNDKGLSECYWRKGIFYNNTEEWHKAVECFEKALTFNERVGDEHQQVNALNAIGAANGFYDQIKSVEITKRALKLAEKIGYQDGIANSLSTLGAVPVNNNRDFDKAASNFSRALEIFEKTNNKGGIAEMLLQFARFCLYESDSNLRKINILPSEKFTKAVAYQKRSLGIYTAAKNMGRQQHGISLLMQTYERMGMYDSALFYYRRWVDAQNNYFTTERGKDLARIETKFLYEKIEDSLTNEQKLTHEKLQTQLIFARQQQQQLDLRQTQLDLTKKEKDLQHLAYMKTQGDLKNEQLIKKQNEREKAITKFNQQRQWIYIIGVFLLLAIGSLYFLYRSRLRSIRLETQLAKEKAAQEKKETEFQHKLADISMSALRSQMNPHFIFNCLNSIKLYTTQNDTVAATEYLTKFSKLIRLVLENSRNERITLSSELAALELYIEMEAMRFKEKLSYSFKVEKDVETGYIEIPPLLLQPYVENAIWHGLMPKEKGGHIGVNVSVKENESVLEIDITDNGIGRVAATALNNKMGGKHRSYGMKATTERIKLINQIYKTGANVIVHDLVDEQGQASGTQVTLQIPV